MIRWSALLLALLVAVTRAEPTRAKWFSQRPAPSSSPAEIARASHLVVDDRSKAECVWGWENETDERARRRSGEELLVAKGSKMRLHTEYTPGARISTEYAPGNLIVFLHIPKAAGTSASKLLEKAITMERTCTGAERTKTFNFSSHMAKPDAAARSDLALIHDKDYLKWLTRDPVYAEQGLFDKCELLCGHQDMSAVERLCRTVPNRNISVMLTLREPVSHRKARWRTGIDVVPTRHKTCVNGSHSPCPTDYDGKDFRNWVEKGEESTLNFQTHWVLGLSQMFPGSLLPKYRKQELRRLSPQETLALALKRLDKLTWIGLDEFYAESACVLFWLLDTEPFDVTTTNVVRHRKGLDPGENLSVEHGDEMPMDVQETIYKRDWMDVILYARAVALHRAKVARMKEELKDDHDSPYLKCLREAPDDDVRQVSHPKTGVARHFSFFGR